ncbi:hypothetical protein [Paenibacillus monticola]|uniref:Uncharacterized protein n=1 Tax=Paenibacillus monticola TaxID=2666075 RepID=A0A7X2HB75_9BACL|nr:hypothetical protein [Paenibacillus monticola]MRN56899.1 hypothetical protein [Paenibacillus monticola]
MTIRIQLPLPLALLFENLRTSGEPDEVVIASIQNKDFSALLDHIAEPAMDITDRAELAEELHIDWSLVVRNGYEFGFLHTNGLKKLLRFRFHRIENRDYVQEGLSLQQLALSGEEIATLQTLIHRQWNVIEKGTVTENGKVRVTLQNKSEELAK